MLLLIILQDIKSVLSDVKVCGQLARINETGEAQTTARAQETEKTSSTNAATTMVSNSPTVAGSGEETLLQSLIQPLLCKQQSQGS